MLKRGWMLRYMPPIVTETIPEYVTFAGYAWAALCFVLAAGTIAVALTGDMKLWAFYVSVVLIGAKVAAFAIQYVAFRILVRSRIRAAARAAERSGHFGTLYWAHRAARDALYRRRSRRPDRTIPVLRTSSRRRPKRWPSTETGISS